MDIEGMERDIFIQGQELVSCDNSVKVIVAQPVELRWIGYRARQRFHIHTEFCTNQKTVYSIREYHAVSRRHGRYTHVIILKAVAHPDCIAVLGRNSYKGKRFSGRQYLLLLFNKEEYRYIRCSKYAVAKALDPSVSFREFQKYKDIQNWNPPAD